MLEDIQAAIPLGFILSFMIGPVFFVLLETSIIKGFRAAVVFDLGVITADVVFLVIAYFSSFQLLEKLSDHPGLYVFGGMILLVYGIVTIFSKTKTHANATLKPIKNNYLNLYVKGFLLNFINIGVLVFWLGVIIVVGPSLDNDVNRISVFAATMLLAYFITDLLKILLAKQLKSKLTPELIHLIKRGLGIILVICGLVLIIKGFLPSDQFNIEKSFERMENITE